MNKHNAKEYLPLVQALDEGKLVQHQKTDGTWIDDVEFSFDWPAHRYRIKPEPKEAWRNRYQDGTEAAWYLTKDEAIRGSSGNCVQVCYREVIE